jgi:hypothetical protein
MKIPVKAGIFLFIQLPVLLIRESIFSRVSALCGFHRKQWSGSVEWNRELLLTALFYRCFRRKKAGQRPKKYEELRMHG